MGKSIDKLIVSLLLTLSYATPVAYAVNGECIEVTLTTH